MQRDYHARMRRLLLLLLAAACAGSNAASTTTRAGRIPANALMAHVSALAADSMRGRLTGTPENAQARQYIARHFAEIGLRRFGEGYEYPTAFLSPRDSSVKRAVNVVGYVRGRVDPERYIVVTAHFDHLGVRNGEVYNGADDNASGTGALIELARWFAANPPRHSVMFAAIDFEEGSLNGARGFVARPPVPLSAIALNVNMDMVGRNARNELFAAGTSHYPYLRPLLDSVATGASISLRFGHDDPGGPRQDDWTTQSDHYAFHTVRIPFVYFGVEDHPDYHRPTDDVERLMPAFYAGAVNTIRDAIGILDRNLEVILARRVTP